VDCRASPLKDVRGIIWHDTASRVGSAEAFLFSRSGRLHRNDSAQEVAAMSKEY
jgi:hypothetical protein